VLSRNSTRRRKKWRLRKTVRSLSRRTGRNLNRSCLRGRRRGPDDLSQAFTAFRRTIRAHHRLARLAPQFFDAVVVDRERENRAEQRRWMAMWEPIIAKVYGVEPQPPSATEELPPLPSPWIQAEVERQLAELDLWMAAGRAAWKRQQQRRPHAVLSLSRIARLLQVAVDFGNLALGLDSKNPLPEKISYDYELTDLKRAYGQDEPPTPAATIPETPEPCAPATVSASCSTSSYGPPVAPEPVVLPSAASPPASPRGDAWSRWARQVRRW
jgi:hypothetical protein